MDSLPYELKLQLLHQVASNGQPRLLVEFASLTPALKEVFEQNRTGLLAEAFWADRDVEDRIVKGLILTLAAIPRLRDVKKRKCFLEEVSPTAPTASGGGVMDKRKLRLEVIERAILFADIYSRIPPWSPAFSIPDIRGLLYSRVSALVPNDLDKARKWVNTYGGSVYDTFKKAPEYETLKTESSFWDKMVFEAKWDEALRKYDCSWY